MSARLTIILPLRGRPLFTLRFLWHANAARLPYKFIIADGEVRQELSHLLENSAKLFPDIDVEYIRYPDDTDFGRYFAKMTDALQRVQTPYAMLADNDDFLALTGLERSLDFLDANPDYVCCGGGIGGFAVYSRNAPQLRGLCGPLNKLDYRYMPYDRSLDLDSSSVAERLSQGLRNSWSYYAVFRSSALHTIWREVAELDLSDLQLFDFWQSAVGSGDDLLSAAILDDAALGLLRGLGPPSGAQPLQYRLRRYSRSHFCSSGRGRRRRSRRCRRKSAQ
jgi:glycosyltransferase domain-containing protein